jgi:type IV pilus assembly protein PilA
MLKIFRKKGQKGFTLVEVMIIICVIIIGAILIMPNYLIYRTRGYDHQAKAELRSYYTACQAYLADNPTLQKACTLAQISGKFVKSPQINIVPAGDSTCRGTTSQYSAPNTQLYTIRRDGDITSYR